MNNKFTEPFIYISTTLCTNQRFIRRFERQNLLKTTFIKICQISYYRFMKVTQISEFNKTFGLILWFKPQGSQVGIHLKHANAPTNLRFLWVRSVIKSGCRSLQEAMFVQLLRAHYLIITNNNLYNCRGSGRRAH